MSEITAAASPAKHARADATDDELAQLLDDVHRIADSLGRIAELVVTVATRMPSIVDPVAPGK
jgi:hypothetical protein